MLSVPWQIAGQFATPRQNHSSLGYLLNFGPHHSSIMSASKYYLIWDNDCGKSDILHTNFYWRHLYMAATRTLSALPNPGPGLHKTITEILTFHTNFMCYGHEEIFTKWSCEGLLTRNKKCADSLQRIYRNIRFKWHVSVSKVDISDWDDFHLDVD